jgi:hypothetical protein
LTFYQPRTKKVRELRSEGLDDEAIEKALRKKGYKFDSIDDPEPVRLPGPSKFPGKVILACHNNDRKAIEAYEDFDELAHGLVGKSFSAETRLGTDEFVKIDGKGFVGPNSQPAQQEDTVAVAAAPPQMADGGGGTVDPEADFDDIPF